MSRSMSGGGGGSWRCKRCHKSNPIDLRRCTGCDNWGDFDWTCSTCCFKNFAKRETCKNCEAARPQEEATATQEGYQPTQEGYQPPVPAAQEGYQGGFNSYSSSYSQPAYNMDANKQPAEIPWMCGLCSIENDPKRIVCFECSGHRERVEVRNRNYSAAPPAPVREMHNDYNARPYHRDPSPYERPGVQQRPNRPFNPSRLGPAPLGKRPEDRTQDWSCNNCENRNFAKRKSCNKCNKPRDEVENKEVIYENEAPKPLTFDDFPKRTWQAERRYDDQYNQPVYRTHPMYNGPPMDDTKRPEDRTKDWSCSSCNNRNFAKRKECNQCKKPRDEVEDATVTFENEDIPPPITRKRLGESFMNYSGSPRKHYRSASYDPPFENVSNDWVCGNCQINCFAKKTECFRCKKPRSEVEVQGADIGQYVKVPEHRAPRHITGHNLQLPDYSDPYSGPDQKKFIVEDRTNDWNCQFCEINNFAKRVRCFKCGKSRNECDPHRSSQEETTNNVLADPV